MSVAQELEKQLQEQYVAGIGSNLVGYIMDYEGGDLAVEDVVKLFAYLVQTGKAWSLQGHYGRTAQSLIEQGLLQENGYVNFDALEILMMDAGAGEEE